MINVKLFATLVMIIFNVLLIRLVFFMLSEPSDPLVAIATIIALALILADWQFYKKVWRRNAKED